MKKTHMVIVSAGIIALLLVASSVVEAGKPTCPSQHPSCKPKPSPTVAPTPTPTPVPTATPIVLTISGVSAYDITQTEAKITWTVSDLATGQVEYGVTNAYGSVSLLESSFNYSTHIQQLSNLLPNTPYHYRAHSVDSAGNEAYSGDYTLTTLAATPTPTPGPTATPGIPGTYSVPASIDATGTRDVSGELQAFFASVADGSTINFSASAIYRIDTPVILTDRVNLTLNGNTATLRTDGFNFVRGTELTIKDFHGIVRLDQSGVTYFYSGLEYLDGR